MPATTKSGQVMFEATPFERQASRRGLRASSSVSHWQRTRKASRVSRQAVEELAPVIRSGERDARFHALLERGGARRVVAAEGDAPEADARGVEVAARLRRSRHRLHRRLRNRRGSRSRIRLRPGPGRRKRASPCRAPRKASFESISSFAESSPSAHDDERRARGTPGLAQDAVERRAFVRERRRARPADRDAAARGCGTRPPSDARRASAVVVDEDELGEVVADGGALRCRRRGERASSRAPPGPALRAPRRAPTRPRTSRPSGRSAAVTSSKSVSGTPFATKRGAQCAIAASTRASMHTPSLILRSREARRRRVSKDGHRAVQRLRPSRRSLR